MTLTEWPIEHVLQWGRGEIPRKGYVRMLNGEKENGASMGPR